MSVNVLPSQTSPVCPLFADPQLGCDWCGAELPPRHRRWCSDACVRAFLYNHRWEDARVEALRRAEVRWTEPGKFGHPIVHVAHMCAHCGDVLEQSEWTAGGHVVEVNHKVPVLGKHALMGCHHHQDGLEVLCRRCHKDVTRRQRAAGWQQVTPRLVQEPTLF